MKKLLAISLIILASAIPSLSQRILQPRDFGIHYYARGAAGLETFLLTMAGGALLYHDNDEVDVYYGIEGGNGFLFALWGHIGVLGGIRYGDFTLDASATYSNMLPSFKKKEDEPWKGSEWYTLNPKIGFTKWQWQIKTGPSFLLYAVSGANHPHYEDYLITDRIGWNVELNYYLTDF